MLTVLICILVVWRPLEIRNDRSTDEELHVEKAYDCSRTRTRNQSDFHINNNNNNKPYVYVFYVCAIFRGHASKTNEQVHQSFKSLDRFEQLVID